MKYHLLKENSMIRSLRCLLLLLPVFALVCMPALAADKPAPLVFACQPLASPGGTLVAVLKHDRILRQALGKAGFTLQFTCVAKGTDSIAQLKSGSADIATPGDMPLLEAAATMPLEIIALTKQSYVSIVGDKGLRVSDLKGKRIGNAVGTTGHFALLKALAGAGLSESDVTMVAMDVNEMTAALLQKKIDAFSLWEPTPETFINTYPDRYAAIARQKSLSFLVVSQRITDKHPEVSSHLAAALIRAMNWLKNDKQAVDLAVAWSMADIRTLTGKPAQTSPNQLARIVRSHLATVGYSPRMPQGLAAPDSSLAEVMQFLKKLGTVPTAVTWETVSSRFNFKAMDQVMKQPKTFQLKRFDYERN